MPRIRTIKPSFFRSEDVSVLPLRARLTWIGLWTHCDDQGRTKDNVKLIKADVWPLDPVSLADIEEDLSTLADAGRIVRYEADGKRYLEITNWGDHQKIDRPSKSSYPPPPSYPQANHRRTLDEPSTKARAGKGRERKGREGNARAREEPSPAAPEPSSEPPPKCQTHIDDPDPPPCGRCADARRARDRWQAEAAARTRAAPRCPRHRGQPAHNCAPCRAEKIAGGTP